MKVGLYVRVSSVEQHPENQLRELGDYCAQREWTVVQTYTDHGVSGAKERRPALDVMLKDAKRRRFAALVVWKLDRLGRNLRHLITTLDELTAVGVGFVSLGEGIDTSTPAGRLQIHLLGAFAQFERDRCRERVFAGLARARAEGKRIGRPLAVVPVERLASVGHLSNKRAAHALGVSHTTMKRWRRAQRRDGVANG